MTQRLFSGAGFGALAAAALVSLSPRLSHAEQFVLFDVTFDFTWEDAINASPSKSHYYVKSNSGLKEQPANWVMPVDYRNGKVHIHLEVLEKPAGGQKQGWALCYVGKAGSYGCPYTDYYTDVGVYDKEVDMTSFYNDDTIDWTKGIAEVDLVYTINDSGSGHVHFFPELKDKTTPTKVRIAMVQVAKNSTYDPAGLPGGTAGAGGSGSGGAGGSGGAAVGGSGGATNGGGPSSGGGGTAGGPQPPLAGAPPLGGAGSGAPSLPSGGTGSGGAASSSAGTSSATPAVTQPTAGNESGGCTTAAGSRSSQGGLLALGALALLRARRRLRA